MKKYYKIVRFYSNGKHVTIKTNLTLEQAQKHCSNPETSSSTCKTAKAKARTRKYGPWFDGYNEVI